MSLMSLATFAGYANYNKRKYIQWIDHKDLRNKTSARGEIR